MNSGSGSGKKNDCAFKLESLGNEGKSMKTNVSIKVEKDCVLTGF